MTADPAYEDYVTHNVSAVDKRVVLLGASGTIGRAVLQELLARGHSVTAPVRSSSSLQVTHPALRILKGELSEQSFLSEVLSETDAIVSCIASRTGVGEDAWAVDYGLNHAALEVAKAVCTPQFILLSAICVQRPKLEFQKAKLAFEKELQASDLDYSIVRPTAFFKSLSGQIERLRAGKPFLVFGDGTLTSCKPISDEDLARFIVACLCNPACQRRVLPVGGPGPAMTPLDQGKALAEALDVTLKTRSVPPAMMNVVASMLSLAGLISEKARQKAELARIGHYYGTQSMLLWDEKNGRYSTEITPEYGKDRLQDYFQKLATGDETLERGEHAVF
ncbi:MAG: NAD(P)H-binding protein [Pseudomonadota bacterium]